MMKFFFLLQIVLLFAFKINGQKFPYKTPLDSFNKIRLEWAVESKDQKQESNGFIVFKAIITERKLPLIFAFGFSDHGEFENADFFLIEILNEKKIKGTDCYTDSNGFLIEDSKSDYKLLNTTFGSNKIEIYFGRKINTFDGNDYEIDTGTTHIIHFIVDDGFKTVRDLIKRGVFSTKQLKDVDKYTVTVQLLKSHAITDEYKNQVLKENRFLEIKNKEVNIPGDETTYWCLVHKLDDSFKERHHIVAFEGIIDKRNIGIVHHMELFHCQSDPSDDSKSFSNVCTSEEKPKGLRHCRNVVAAWAMGANVFVYPEHVGGLIGGDNSSLYLVLEIHYNNERLRQDIVDSSGIRVYYTEDLRENNAGIMEVGLEYNAKNSIPPQSQSFNLSGYCLTDCTEVSLPTKGITVFATQLHTHLTGRKVWTTILRKNRQQRVLLSSDFHYNPMFQEIRMLEKPIRILPGDTIINTCEYRTMSRGNMTFGGYGIRDEMCVNYMHYYPAAKLEACKSSIRDDVLNQFFKSMNNYVNAKTLPTNTIEKNFNRVPWTPLASRILHDLYNKAPISFSCNSSDGENILKNLGRDMNDFYAIDLSKDDFKSNNYDFNNDEDDDEIYM